MNKTEAIRMMLDGKKIRKVDTANKNCYCSYVNGKFFLNIKDFEDSCDINYLRDDDDYEEYTEPRQYFDFMTAVNHMKNGKTVYCEDAIFDGYSVPDENTEIEITILLINSTKWYLKEDE